MKLKHLIVGTGIGLFGLMGACASTYTVSETQHAVVERVGNAKRIVVNVHQPGITKEADVVDPEAKAQLAALHAKYDARGIEISVGAGLYFKVPFFDNVTYQDARYLEYDIAPREVVTRDKKKIVTDVYARWRIWDPLQFKLSARNETGMKARLDDVIYNRFNEIAGQNNAVELIRSDNTIVEAYPELHLEAVERGREAVMGQITQKSDEDVKEKYGTTIADVRMKRADLPESNKKSVFDRMRAERERIFKGFDSEGDSLYNSMTAATERQVSEIKAAAYKEAEAIKGTADAQATRIYAEAYSKDPEFFQFWRTMEAYKGGVLDGSQTVLDTDSAFLKYLKGPNGK